MRRALFQLEFRRCPHHPVVAQISTSSTVSARKVPQLAESMNVHDYGKANAARRRLYVFGLPAHGGLGIASLVRPAKYSLKKINRPIRHELGDVRSVTHAAAGHGFSLLAVKRRGEDDNILLYGSGLNTHSQIGYHAPRVNAPLEVLIDFVPIQLPVTHKGKVLAVGCGRAHTVVSLKGDGLFTLGDNSSGQCGRRVIYDEAYSGSKYIHKIKDIDPVANEVVKVVSRFDVTYCLTSNRGVLSFGSNLKGQLGRGRKVAKEWEPVHISGDLSKEKVVSVSTSGSSTMAVTDKGELFAWGCNDAGNIDPRSPGQLIYEPRHVKFGSKIGKVLDVAVGELCSFAVNERGDVYTWGHGPLLGLGPDTSAAKVPTLIPPTLFGRNEFNPASQVRRVVCSFLYAAAITSDGSLYTWGRNASGCLGLGPMDHQHFPLKVFLGGRVVDVALGVDHTLVISAGGL